MFVQFDILCAWPILNLFGIILDQFVGLVPLWRYETFVKFSSNTTWYYGDTTVINDQWGDLELDQHLLHVMVSDQHKL